MPAFLRQLKLFPFTCAFDASLNCCAFGHEIFMRHQPTFYAFSQRTQPFIQLSAHVASINAHPGRINKAIAMPES